MADVHFIGAAIGVAQVSTAQITAFDATTTYSLTVNGVSISVPGNTSVNQTATDLAAAWTAEIAHPYFTPVVASAATDTVTLTGPAGMPFTVTSSVTGGTGTIGAVTEGTAATGPYHWDESDNWSGGSVPAASDNVFITRPGSKVLWALDQNTLALTDIHVRDDLTVGLRADRVATVADAATVDATAPEYRQTYLKLQWDTTHIGEWLGQGSATGPGRCKMHNSKAGASTTTVHNTNPSSTDGENFPAVRLLFDNSGADVFVRFAQAGVGIAADVPTETATIGDVVVTDATTSSKVIIGNGVTLTTHKQSGGDVVLGAAANITTVTMDGGRLLTRGDYTVTTATVSAGTLTVGHKQSTGAVIFTTLNQDGGSVSFFDTGEAVTVTTYNFDSGERKSDENLTITNDNRSGRITETILK